MSALSGLLVILATFAALFGLASLSNATLGIGIIAFACFLAILARLAQAAAHANPKREEADVATTARPMTSEQGTHFQKMQRRRQVAGVAALALVAGLLAVGFVVRHFVLRSPNTLTAETAQAPGALTVSISDKSDAWWIANETNYIWNVCWAERQGRRAFMPTMNVKATVTVRHDDFKPEVSAHSGNDLQVTCSYDGDDVASPIRVNAVVKP
jgi:hypothetical protein